MSFRGLINGGRLLAISAALTPSLGVVGVGWCRWRLLFQWPPKNLNVARAIAFHNSDFEHRPRIATSEYLKRADQRSKSSGWNHCNTLKMQTQIESPGYRQRPRTIHALREDAHMKMHI